MDQEVAKTLGELELKLQELEHELTTIGHHEKPAEPQAPGKLVDEAVEHRNSGEIDTEASLEEQAVADGDGFGGPPVFGGEEVPAQAGATIERDWTVQARETAYGEIPTPPSPPLPPPQSPPSMAWPPPPSTPPGPPFSSPPPGITPPSTPPAPLAPSTPPGATPPSTPQETLSPSSPPGMHLPSSSPGSHFPPPDRPDPRRPAAVEENQSIDLAELVRFRDKLASTMDGLIEEYSRLLSVDAPSRSRSDA
ncbi:MAG: hypothetical protein WAN93_09790 [Solirubrobacteraceae bacterium]